MASEKRLIAFDPVTFEAFTRSLTKFRNPYDTYDDGYLDATQRIEEWLEINTVDAVEVVHGRWVEKPNPWGQDGSHSYDCSICGERTCVVGHKLRYCPNCGAKMDGERKDNERKAD